MTAAERQPNSESTPAGPLIEARRLERHYGYARALRGIDLAASGGELILVTGANGAGKSTLLRCLAGLARPSRGEVLVAGQALRSHPALRSRLGYLAHAAMVYDDLTVGENLRFAAALHGLDASAVIEPALAAERLTDRADHAIRSLSHGLRQRLALARATLHRPDVLLLDEPFAGLDGESAERLRHRLADRVAAGQLTICTSHQWDELLPVVTRVVQLDHGRVIDDAPRQPRSDRSAPTPQFQHPPPRPAGCVNELRVALAIAAKDLRIEWRHRTAFASALLFVVLVLTAFVFARNSATVSLAELAPPVLWVVLALATLITLNRAFTLEREHQALDGLLLAPVSSVALYWGKWFANLVIVAAVEACAVALWMLFFNIAPSWTVVAIGAVAWLAAVGFTAPGTLFAAIAVRTRFAEMLLPVLLLPFVIPPLFFAAGAATTLLAHATGVWGWLRLLALYDVTFLVLASMLFPSVIDQ